MFPGAEHRDSPEAREARRLAKASSKAQRRSVSPIYESNPELPIMLPSQMYPQQLNATKQEVRLLTILPGKFDTPIRCTLTKVSLADKPKYNALSYAWGDPQATKDVVVDDALFAVTINLENALRHVRSESETSSVSWWIDAMCINQGDVQERNGQVGIMDDVYKSASEVVIWLGHGDEEINLAFGYFKQGSSATFNEESKETMTEFLWATVRDVPWFNRVWVMQEMALAAEDPVVVYGHHSVPWSVLYDFWCDLVAQYPKAGRLTQAAKRIVGEWTYEDALSMAETIVWLPYDYERSRMRALGIVRREYQSKGGMALRAAFVHSRFSTATDPRAQICGILSLLENKQRKLRSSIDYEQPVHIVFAQATAYILAEDVGLDFFSRWPLTGLSPVIGGLPSWALDFSSAKDNEIEEGGFVFGSMERGSVDGNQHPVKGRATVVDDMRTLEVIVLPVDEIVDVFHFGDKWPECLTTLPDISLLADAAKERPDRPLDEGFIADCFRRFRSSEPLWRTLLHNSTDTMAGPEPVRAELEADYNNLLENVRNGRLHDVDLNGEYVTHLKARLVGRAFITTRAGLVGLADSKVRVGDEVSIWFGSGVPFVTRPSPYAPGTCGLVSTAYVAGIMEGQMVDELYLEGWLRTTKLYVR
ncbi:unnamed protein product [Zymoseptoria tritici ST99CH_1E4]|uniref:Heterokaryon incompatibility domain-containing protein n=1 Tax=Zymoseptoria tritici ST99CH_1E4 TaxID=1276532 RepID=A0A2H1FWB1_ZYMTR|nr:unnamed protein product [Zymoseptoria tritici ST99CH_1E4]